MERDTIELLRKAREEITTLRRANEVLAAKVEVMDLFAEVLRTNVHQPSRCMSIDVAWEIQQKLEQVRSGLGTVEGIRAIMGYDVPVLIGAARADIPWIKRLRDKTGCGLKEAKDAMELMLQQPSNHDLAEEHER